MADPEEVVRMIAQLRVEHPRWPVALLHTMIDYGALRRRGETYESFMARHFGPMEPL